MAKITSLADDALIAIDNIQDIASNMFTPTLRLGVTGLSRAGKTVFISSLIHNLLNGGRLPMFEAYSSGRIAKAELQPQPSMDLPRFQYEKHIETLIDERMWPQSTRAISELRLTIYFESASGWKRKFGSGTLNLDIVDYPGEWLLDLPLLKMDFAQWSAQALALAKLGNRNQLSAKWLDKLKKIDPNAPMNEVQIEELSNLFKSYLQSCRSDESALSTLPPGRFLMPGDLEGSPALTFTPLDLETGSIAPKDSLHEMMEARYEAYKRVVIKPFFREHFARLDRQIVLVDTLQAVNAGPEALSDLETAITEILSCYKTGASSWFGSVVSRKIDKLLFAATKADQVHHENHDKMEALLRKLIGRSVERAKFSGAKVEVLALSAIRATKEAIITESKDEFPVLVGTPLMDEVIEGKKFDGEIETAVFPGDLPNNPNVLFSATSKNTTAKSDLKFVRFRPPEIEEIENGLKLSLPHIRLDRALEFLLSDQLT